ncbi:MAG: UDP-N-acetylmuramyl-tripeptide synthetase [Candidatus Saccharibacteria bacterium]|nr:UDP-N-acetylmuramyl-tripeptide synthetase [Candidatus Saccharibacteria bacterium]
MAMRSLVKKVIPKGVFRKIEPVGHTAEAMLRNVQKGFPAKGLKVIGVTGTNGKTSTCFLIHKMLTDAGYKVGLMSTVAYGYRDNIKPQMTHMTSQTVPVFLKRVQELKDQGAEWLILETTSHALAQGRVWGVPYTVAVMTNITHEHLAYHGTFERYLAAKRKLFTMTNKNRKGLRVGIINADDEHAKDFATAIAHPVTYGLEGGDVKAANVKLLATGVEYDAVAADKTYHITCQLPGSFNVSNSLAAVCVGRALGLGAQQIEQGIAALEGVEGRMTPIDEGQDFTVIVDYAHTPDSFEKLFKDMRPVIKGKMIVLFGSLGGGDKGKRPLQGELAGKYADEVIVTMEDDRQEDPQTILNDIAVGAEKAGKVRQKDLFIIHDRPEAIRFAFDHAQKGDTVLLLGKGHEKTIEDATGEHPWNEAEEAKKALRQLA